MPLYIKDNDVDDLTKMVQEKAGVRTKTEAVRLALQHELQRINEKLPASERIKKSLALADAMGPSGNDDFDMKAFTDEMWGEA
jgi:antitoxin VapB